MAEAGRPEAAVEMFKAVVKNFLNTANPDERFAAWWTRTY
ncbi:hypothetical protein DFAR_630046 [Desulfarculales bacterium]